MAPLPVRVLVLDARVELVDVGVVDTDELAVAEDGFVIGLQSDSD